MVIDKNDAKLVTLEQLGGFAGAISLLLSPPADPATRYKLIKKVLEWFKYPLQGKVYRV